VEGHEAKEREEEEKRKAEGKGEVKGWAPIFSL
jgi:hypothetical protein